MTVRLFQRRLAWCPTRWGWATICVLLFTPFLLWWWRGETFLSANRRIPADILVAEGWISGEGISACAREFRNGGYRYVVATGGLTGESWSQKRWNYAVEAEEQLLRAGIPREQVILAAARETGNQRTYEMAQSTREVLRAHHIEATSINVFTRGAHARRSQLVFTKVFGRETDVGVISWTPPGRGTEHWSKSSERAEDMIKETVGYVFELLLNSGRDRSAVATNPPITAGSPP